MFYSKAPSSPDVVSGVIEGVEIVSRMAREQGLDTDVRIVHLHGTTVATNVLLEQKGARVALLGTNGHQDALELGRMKRSHLYDLNHGPETPGHLVPGRYRIGIRERLDGQGRVLEALDEAQLIEEVDRLVGSLGVEAIAICFLNAHANGSHERRAAEVIHERHPDLPVSISSNVNPVFREYERTCCTVFDAYVRPKVEHYVRQLASNLKGEEDRLHLMQSRGGITSARMAKERPVSMFLSGPAAGVVAGKFVAETADYRDVLTFDVGGTSTDVSLVRGGVVETTQEGRIDRFPLRMPMVGIETVGSGGGSVAWLDAGNALHVGPKSAGSVPGPACYGRGGTEPTATDASVVLGYINPEYFAGGLMSLDVDRARSVIQDISDKLGMPRHETALGITRILVSQMAEAIKLITIKRGLDPRDFAIVAFGGGGGIYAPMVAQHLGIRDVLVPRNPGTLSAFGLLVSDFEYDQVRTVFVSNASQAECDKLEAHFQAMEAEGADVVLQEGYDGEAIVHRRSFDMRYLGQAYELEVPIPFRDPITPASMEKIVELFHTMHDSIYGHSSSDRTVEIVNLRVVTSRPAPELDPAVLLRDLPNSARPGEPAATRQAYFPEIGAVDTPAFRRDQLGPGSVVDGPCIVESSDTTVVLQPGQKGTCDRAGNLVVSGS